MKRKNLFEIIGVLSLSFMLTCAMAISGAIPAMIEAFPGYSRSSVEFLLSVTSFMMMLMVALSPIISRYIPERLIVITGLVIYTISGITPVFIQSYPVMFISRILLGLGTGLINTKAISMIGERFTGELQQKLQGIRCSMETLGQTILTLVAGQLLVFGWNYSFLIYGASLIILILFVAFVPERKMDASITNSSEITEKGSLTFADMPFLIGNALLGFLMVSTNVSLSLRISSYVIEVGIGTAADGATIMGISTFAGFIAGIAFGFMSKKLGKILLPVSLLIGISGLFTVILAHNFILTAAGTALIGFCVTCCTSIVFGSLPERFPANKLTTVNAVVLMGCNLGCFAAPFLLRIVDQINPAISTAFWAYGIIYLILIVFVILKLFVSKNKSY